MNFFCLFSLSFSLLQQRMASYCNEKIFVALIHSLHKNIWPDTRQTRQRLDDYSEDGDSGTKKLPSTTTSTNSMTSADVAVRVVVNCIQSHPFHYMFSLKPEAFSRYLINSFTNREKNQILIYDMITVIFNHLKCSEHSIQKPT